MPGLQVQAGVRMPPHPLLPSLPPASCQCHWECWERPPRCMSMSLGWGAGPCQAQVAQGHLWHQFARCSSPYPPGFWPDPAMMAPPGWRDAPQPPGRWGATLQPPQSGSPHRPLWYSQGSPGEVPLPLGVQDLFPSWWLVDAYFSPSPTMRALPSDGDGIGSPIRRRGYILCHAVLPAGTGGVGAVGHCLLPCRGGEEPFPTANTAGGSGASGRATNALQSRNCRGRFGRGSDPQVRIRQRQGRDQRAKVPAPACAACGDTPTLAGSQATSTHTPHATLRGWQRAQG